MSLVLFADPNFHFLPMDNPESFRRRGDNSSKSSRTRSFVARLLAIPSWKQKRARIADFRCREKQIEVQSKEDEVDTGSKQQTRS
jgi:hypothetical protein